MKKEREAILALKIKTGDVIHHKWFNTNEDFRFSAEVMEVIEELSELIVWVEYSNDGFPQTWNLEHTLNALKSGEYIMGEPSQDKGE